MLFQSNQYSVVVEAARDALRDFQFERAKEIARLIVHKDGANLWSDELSRIIQQVDLVDVVRTAGTLKAYEQFVITLRREYFNRALSIYMADEAIEKFGSRGFDIERISFLRILSYREYEPAKLEELVVQFLESFPGSAFRDDVLAELVYTQALSQEKKLAPNLPLAEKTARRLFRDYPGENANDNALNWLAFAYLRECKRKFGDEVNMNKKHEIEECQQAKRLYKEVLGTYPWTRFGEIARDELSWLRN
jgi:hypothetical protein